MANGCPKAFIRVDKKSLSRATTDKLTWLGVPWNVPNSFPYVSKEEATALLVSKGMQNKLLFLSSFLVVHFLHSLLLASSFHLFSCSSSSSTTSFSSSWIVSHSSRPVVVSSKSVTLDDAIKVAVGQYSDICFEKKIRYFFSIFFVS
jgi:hypothetical protein